MKNYNKILISIKWRIFPLLLILLASSLQAQDDEGLIQFSGRIKDTLNQPLEYAHVVNVSMNKAVATDKKGMFTIIVQPQDTVVVTSIGYKAKTIIIPNQVEGASLIRDIVLPPDTITIAEVRIFPWKTYEEFKEAFLALELEDDDYDRARKNVALIYTQMLFDDTPIPTQTFRFMMQEQYEKLYMRGQYPTSQLLNPIAWGRFFEALKNGEIRMGTDDEPRLPEGYDE